MSEQISCPITSFWRQSLRELKAQILTIKLKTITTIIIIISSSSSSSNNNNNASISIVQNKLFSVALKAVQTNMSLVSWQKSTKKQTQSEGSLANCSTQENR